MMVLRVLALAPVVVLVLGFLYMVGCFLVRTPEGNILAGILAAVAFTAVGTLLLIALGHFGFTGDWEWFPSEKVESPSSYQDRIHHNVKVH